MNRFQERLIAERSDLLEKRVKLNNFLNSDAYNKISPAQKSLLRVQHYAMGTYESCLKERIEWLESTECTETGPISNGLAMEEHPGLKEGK